MAANLEKWNVYKEYCIMSNHVLIKSESFTYPSRGERKSLSDEYPKIPVLKFDCKVSKVDLLTRKVPFEHFDRKNNLFYWNRLLYNRFQLVKESYVIAMVNYRRGFTDDPKVILDESQFVNKWKFDYYAEMFYYLFFSAQDQLAHILKIFYELMLEERQTALIPVLTCKIQNEEVKTVLNTFAKTTGDAREYRNAFAHRFPPTEPDFRSEFNIINANKELNFREGPQVSAEKIVANMKSSIDALNELMIKLRELVTE